MQPGAWCILAGLILFNTSALIAQDRHRGSVSGLVADKSTHRPIENVNVVLRNQADSTLVNGAVTDHNGKFVIQNIPEGRYFIQCSFTGYAGSKTPAFTINAQHQGVILGKISMAESALRLKEIVVTAERTRFNNSIDRKVYNVDRDILSKTGSAGELLQNIPSIVVDLDGHVSLRGSSNVEILINGKPSALMGKSRASVLQQLPANLIERIEVITNPSAKFRPDGMSGIINIVLRKPRKKGVNGGLTANAGNSWRYNSGLRINDHFGRVNLYGSYSLKKDDRVRLSTRLIEREATDSQQLSASRENRQSFSRPMSHIAGAGIDLNLSPNNSLGVSGDYYYKGFTQRDTTTRVLKNNDGVITAGYDRSRLDYEHESEAELAVYYQHNFEKEDHDLRFELNAAHVPEEEDNHFTEVHRIPECPPQFDNTLIKQGEDQVHLSIDYNNPLNENSQLEAGYDGDWDKRDLDFYGEYYNAGLHKFLMDVQKTNRFLLDQSIHALYSTYAHTYGPFRLEGGLRAEQAFIKAHLVTTDSLVNHRYFDLYPTLHLAYKVNKASEFQMSYSRRVHRPEEDELNPFPEYHDPRNLEAGNPYLLPEKIHSLEAGYQWENDRISVISSIYYRYKYNGFTSITESINDSTLLTTRKNLSSDQSAGVELIFSANMGKFLTANVSSNIFYNQIDASNIGYGGKKTRVSWNSTFNLNLNLTGTTKLQINSHHRSARSTPQGAYRSRTVVNMGIRQNIKKKIFIILSVSDLFKSLNQKTELHIPGLDESTDNRRDTRIIYLGLTCRFGASDKKAEEEPQYDNQL